MVSATPPKENQGRSRWDLNRPGRGPFGRDGSLSELESSGLDRFRRKFLLVDPDNIQSEPVNRDLGILAEKIKQDETIGLALKYIQGLRLESYRVGCTKGTKSALIFYSYYQLETEKKGGRMFRALDRSLTASLRKIAKAVESATDLPKAVINSEKKKVTFAVERHGDFQIMGKNFSTFAELITITVNRPLTERQDSYCQMTALPMPDELQKLLKRLNSNGEKKE